MRENNKNPLCEQKQNDCNRNHDGRCVLLSGTHFNKTCPFYKKREEAGKKNGR